MTIASSRDAFADGSALQNNAAYIEGADAAANSSTIYTIGVGDTFSGTLNSVGDNDWIAINLTAGTSTLISLSNTAGSPSLDTYLELYNSSGTLIASNDDAGAGYNSQLEFAATTTGTYYINARSFNNASSGAYQITASDAGATLPVYTNDQIATYLGSGYWGESGGSAHAFNVGGDNSISVNITALTVAGRNLATLALEAWTNVTGISFSFVTGSAEITFDDNQSGAFSTSSLSGSTIVSSEVNVSTAWLSSYGTTVDSYAFQTYIHEIGHALGLGHAGNYNGSASYVTTVGAAGNNQYLNDSWQATIMSYFSQADNTFINGTYAYVVTPMIADILAIQSLYGITNANQRTGNTIYGDNSTAGGYLDTLNGLTNAVATTVLDDGGTDTFDFGSATQNQRIDMRAETISNVYGATGNLTIARGTVIENAIGGSGSDTIIGNDAANVITGGGGGDTITGGAGADVFVFGFGANNNGDTVTDYAFGSTNVATGAIAGDVIYFGGVSGVTVSQSGSDLVVNGVTLTGAASGNLVVAYRSAVTSVSYSSAASLFAGGAEFADLTVMIYDFGTQESFDFITFTYDQNGVAAAIDTTFDTSIRILETFDSLSNETWETITRTYNAAGVLSEIQTAYDNATSLLTAYDADNSANWETVDEYRDAAGDLYDRRVNYDTGNAFRTRYDVDGVYNWTTAVEYRDDAGELYDNRVNYDTGNAFRTRYDVNGAYNWETVLEYRNAAGELYDNRVNYDTGNAFRTRYDVDSVYSWETVLEYRNAAGELYDYRVNYDTGNAVRTRYDVDGANGWETVLEYRNATGELYDYRVNYDTGNAVRTRYDVDSVYNWETVLEYRNAAGELYDYRVNYDTGNAVRTRYDVDEAFVWETVLEYRNAAGELYDYRVNYDTGNAVRTRYDVDEAFVWETVLEYRNAAGELYDSRVNYDNGNLQIVLYDVDDAYAWETHTRLFDDVGNLISETFL